MTTDLKKRLSQYIEKYQKKGYSLEQIRRALILYGFEPRYVEEVISGYKQKNALHVILFLIIVLGLPFLANPAITGYFFLNDIDDLNLRGIELLALSIRFFLTMVFLGLALSAFLASWKGNKINPLDKIDRKYLIEKIKDIVTHKNNSRLFLWLPISLRQESPLKTFLAQDNLSKFLSIFKLKKLKPSQNEPSQENVNYVLSNPLLSLYIFFIIIGVLTAIVSVLFQKWQVMVFGVIGIVFALIGYMRIKRMYYKEEGIR